MGGAGYSVGLHQFAHGANQCSHCGAHHDANFGSIRGTLSDAHCCSLTLSDRGACSRQPYRCTRYIVAGTVHCDAIAC